ncbi:MAG: hypothetical protein IT215_02425 [Chitinophagaceae bacterium]|nr:hypothetical protein [Chitinophagaceae bacterium]
MITDAFTYHGSDAIYYELMLIHGNNSNQPEVIVDSYEERFIRNAYPRGRNINAEQFSKYHSMVKESVDRILNAIVLGNGDVSNDDYCKVFKLLYLSNFVKDPSKIENALLFKIYFLTPTLLFASQGGDALRHKLLAFEILEGGLKVLSETKDPFEKKLRDYYDKKKVEYPQLIGKTFPKRFV